MSAVTTTSEASTPDGGRILKRDFERVQVCDAATGKPLHILEGHTANSTALAMSPEGRLLVSGAWDPYLRVWDLETGQFLRAYVCQGRSPAAAIAPDGRLVASGGISTAIGLWDIESAQLLGTLAGHTMPVLTMAFSADGRTLVSGSEDKTVRVWDVKLGRCVHLFSGHAFQVNSVVLTPDGCLTVSGSDDATVRFWDLRSGRCVSIRPQPYKITSVRIEGPAIGVLDEARRECIYIPHNFERGPGALTAVRFWRFGASGKAGQWDAEINATCPWCKAPLRLPASVFEALQAIAQSIHLSPAQVPSLALPDSVWEDPRLVSSCPDCQRPLQFNPWIVDFQNSFQRCRTAHVGPPPSDTFLTPPPRGWNVPAGVLADAVRPPYVPPALRSSDDISHEELKSTATGSYERGAWEAAAISYEKLLLRGEPLVNVAEQLVTCLMNVHPTLSETTEERIVSILIRLREAGAGALADALGRRVAQKRVPERTKKSWWRIF